MLWAQPSLYAQKENSSARQTAALACLTMKVTEHSQNSAPSVRELYTKESRIRRLLRQLRRRHRKRRNRLRIRTRWPDHMPRILCSNGRLLLKVKINIKKVYSILESCLWVANPRPFDRHCTWRESTGHQAVHYTSPQSFQIMFPYKAYLLA